MPAVIPSAKYWPSQQKPNKKKDLSLLIFEELMRGRKSYAMAIQGIKKEKLPLYRLPLRFQTPMLRVIHNPRMWNKQGKIWYHETKKRLTQRGKPCYLLCLTPVISHTHGILKRYDLDLCLVLQDELLKYSFAFLKELYNSERIVSSQNCVFLKSIPMFITQVLAIEKAPQATPVCFCTKMLSTINVGRFKI